MTLYIFTCCLTVFVYISALSCLFKFYGRFFTGVVRHSNFPCTLAIFKFSTQLFEKK